MRFTASIWSMLILCPLMARWLWHKNISTFCLQHTLAQMLLEVESRRPPRKFSQHNLCNRHPLRLDRSRYLLLAASPHSRPHSPLPKLNSLRRRTVRQLLRSPQIPMHLLTSSRVVTLMVAISHNIKCKLNLPSNSEGLKHSLLRLHRVVM